MNRMRLRLIRVSFAVGVCLFAFPRPDAAQFKPLERLVGRTAETSPSAAASGGPIEIVIESWSTDAERESLRTALNGEGGPDKLIAALLKMSRRAGVILFPGQTGLGARVRQRRGQVLRYASEIKTPTGRQFIVVAAEPLGFEQPNRSLRATESQFSLIDIRLGSDGKGVGKVALASQVTDNKNTKTIELGNYDTQPVRLSDVRSEKP